MIAVRCVRIKLVKCYLFGRRQSYTRAEKHWHTRYIIICPLCRHFISVCLIRHQLKDLPDFHRTTSDNNRFLWFSYSGLTIVEFHHYLFSKSVARFHRRNKQPVAKEMFLFFSFFTFIDVSASSTATECRIVLNLKCPLFVLGLFNGSRNQLLLSCCCS